MWAPPLLLTSNFKTPALEVQIPWNSLLWPPVPYQRLKANSSDPSAQCRLMSDIICFAQNGTHHQHSLFPQHQRDTLSFVCCDQQGHHPASKGHTSQCACNKSILSVCSRHSWSTWKWQVQLAGYMILKWICHTASLSPTAESINKVLYKPKCLCC